MTYIKLPPNETLTDNIFVDEMNKAIKCCDEYEVGMEVIDIHSGYELQLNGATLPTNISAPILSKAKRMVIE
jgi:hypothetical protein